jgi:hypothetical protein
MEINEGNEWYGVFTVLDPGSRAFFTPRDQRSGPEIGDPG